MRSRLLAGAVLAAIVGTLAFAVKPAGEARAAQDGSPPAKSQPTIAQPAKMPAARGGPAQAQPAKSPPAKVQQAKPAAGATAAAAGAAVALAPHQVTGFRSARFGMTEPALRAAIAKDFRLKPDALRKAANPRDGTTTLIAETTNLLPGAGRSAIAYVQGHRSGSLIQVNVLWGAPFESGRSARELAEIAEPLVAYFQRLRFAPLSVAVNVAREDGRITLFQGRDQNGRMVSFDLRIGKAPDGRPDPAAVGAGLQLAYVADPDKPDVKPVAANAGNAAAPAVTPR